MMTLSSLMHRYTPWGGGTGTEAVAARIPTIREQIDQLVNDPKVSKEEKIDRLARYRTTVNRNAIRSGIAAGVAVAVSFALAAFGTGFIMPLAGLGTLWTGCYYIGKTDGWVKNGKYADGAIKKVKAQPVSQPALATAKPDPFDDWVY